MTARARTTRADWLAAGLDLLRVGGGDALTLERLCRALERTKGAFYHHFGDISAYHEALLAHWVDSHTEQMITAADRHASAARARDAKAARRQALYRAVSQVDIGIELAVQAWALRASNARAAVARVHARRIAYLTGLHATKEHAARDAELEYAVFLGALHLYPDVADRTHRRKLQQALHALLEPKAARKLRPR